MSKQVQTAVILALSITLGLYAASSAAEAVGWAGGGDSVQTCPVTGSSGESCPYAGKADKTKSSCPFSGVSVPSPGPRDET